MKKYLLLALGAVVGSTTFTAKGMLETADTPLTQLLCDMGKYKIHYRTEYRLIEKEGRKPRADLWFHRGNLLAHTMWVDQHLANGACLAQLFEAIRGPEWRTGLEPKEIDALSINWCTGISDRMRFVASIAALSHDSGKAGAPLCYYTFYSEKEDPHAEEYAIRADGSIPYVEKRKHEKIGMRYILHSIKNPAAYPAYCMVDGSEFDFNWLFNQFGLTLLERQIVAALVAAHKIFAKLYNRDLGPKSAFPGKEITLEQFNKKLAAIIEEVGLAATVAANPALRIDILKMIMALTMADLLGVYFEGMEGIASPALGRFVPVLARRPFFERQTYTTPHGDVTVDWPEREAHLDYCKISFCAAAHWRSVLLGEVA